MDDNLKSIIILCFNTYKDTFYAISIETIQELLNLINITGTSLVIASSSSAEVTYPNEIEIYDYYRSNYVEIY